MRAPHGTTRYHAPMVPRSLRRTALAAVAGAALLLAGCAPGALQEAPAGPPAEASDLERTAWAAWHYMELGRLEEGAYTTNALVDLRLPQGVRWDLVDFGEEGYALEVRRVDAEGEPEVAYHVDPEGVRPAR